MKLGFWGRQDVNNPLIRKALKEFEKFGAKYVVSLGDHVTRMFLSVNDNTQVILLPNKPCILRDFKWLNRVMHSKEWRDAPYRIMACPFEIGSKKYNLTKLFLTHHKYPPHLYLSSHINLYGRKDYPDYRAVVIGGLSNSIDETPVYNWDVIRRSHHFIVATEYADRLQFICYGMCQGIIDTFCIWKSKCRT